MNTVDPAGPSSGFSPVPVPPALLGESPLWHPDEQVLYWVDIPGRALHRYDPARSEHRHWPQPSEPACCVPLLGGGLLVAMRDGLWRFDPKRGERSLLAKPPYDPSKQRFNDGKADVLGRFWIGTIDDAREPNAALYCHTPGQGLKRVAEDIAASNGLAFSPDGRTMLWADTKSHAITAFDIDLHDGGLSRRRLWRQFPLRDAAGPLSAYGGRPDGAAMDSEGAYWIAMFEGQRLLRLAPDGSTLADIPLPVRCPTMPCFGGPDLRTLYVTTARDKRPADELAEQPWAGCLLQCRVEVPGLPAHLARL